LLVDDGPNPQTTPKALEYLRNNNLTATFFVNGINYGDVENDPVAVNLIKQEYQEGHDIGSHTYYHKDLFEAIQEGTMEMNIDKMTDKIEEIIGVKPAFFRPPCGRYNEKVQKYLGASGYSVIMWGTDTRDWEHKDNVELVIAELNKELAAPGVSPATHSFISLMHDVHPTTVDTILPAVVDYVKSLGYQFVSLPEC
ncbi:carbohydrate esterase family 4 protein, partial [Piromyces sp. E2]